MKDIILIIEGGGILGVFGAGVLTAFQEANIYNRIKCIYATSAGAHDAAYFLTKQSKLGSSIYFKDLTDKHFIRIDYKLRYIKDIFLHKFNKNHKIHDVINLDFLIKLEKRVKNLKIKELQRQKIPLFVRVFNIESLKHEYLNCKKDPLKALKASSTNSPYYSKSVKIDNNNYIDGSVIDSKNFIEIIKSNPKTKIIYILNHEKNLSYLWNFRIRLFPLDFLAFVLLFGIKVALLREFSIYNFTKKKEIKRFSNVYLISNDLNNNIICTNKSDLKKLYSQGIRKGKEITKIINKG